MPHPAPSSPPLSFLPVPCLFLPAGTIPPAPSLPLHGRHLFLLFNARPLHFLSAGADAAYPLLFLSNNADASLSLLFNSICAAPPFTPDGREVGTYAQRRRRRRRWGASDWMDVTPRKLAPEKFIENHPN